MVLAAFRAKHSDFQVLDSTECGAVHINATFNFHLGRWASKHKRAGFGLISNSTCLDPSPISGKGRPFCREVDRDRAHSFPRSLAIYRRRCSIASKTYLLEKGFNCTAAVIYRLDDGGHRSAERKITQVLLVNEVRLPIVFH